MEELKGVINKEQKKEKIPPKRVCLGSKFLWGSFSFSYFML